MLAVIVVVVAGGTALLVKQFKPASPASVAPVKAVRGEPIRPVAPVSPAPATTPAATAARESAAPAAPATRPAADSKPAVVAAPTVVAAGGSDYLTMGFERLSAFNYDVPDESKGPQKAEDATKTSGQIPTEVRALNNKHVALKGFMLPLKVEGGLITELLIMRDQSMCCYGTTPRINEWVSVRMSGKGVKPIMDQPVTLYGTLKVGEIRENGYLVGIYEMVGEKMDVPENL